MINNFFKIIHNKYSRFFRFIFFLRYLLLIFIISITIFLILPNFFNYEKRAQAIKNYLLENYNYEINDYDSIKYKSFPSPTLSINNVEGNIKSSKARLFVQNLKLKPKLISIYNFNNFQLNKIYLSDISISQDISDFKTLKKFLFSQKKKFNLINLNLKLKDNNNSLVEIKKIKFSNYGYSRDLIEGEIFDKKFKLKINENFDKIDFKLINSGFSSEINFDNNENANLLSGIFKSKILNTNIKFNFIYNDFKLKILNAYFRSKNLSFNNESLIVLKPFLFINSDIVIEDLNLNIIKNLKLDKIIEFKDMIKKINGKNNINFLSKKFTRGLIEDLNLNIELAYGRINYKKNFSISDNFIDCRGNINLLEEFPLLFFECSLISENIEKFLNEFSIKRKLKVKNLKVDVEGNLNIFNKKINFTKILINDEDNTTKEDLKYYKETFETYLFDKNFIEIFSYKKIKEFLIEIS